MKNVYNLIFIGSSKHGLPSLDALFNSKRFNISALVTQPDKPQGRKRIIVESEIVKYGKKNNLLSLYPYNINNEKIIKKLESLRPDVVLIINYGQILKSNFLKIADSNIFNLHYSLLPKYRGASPVQYALLNGDTSTGITIFKIDEKMDHGPIYFQKKININQFENSEQLKQKMSTISSKIIKNNLIDILENKIKPKIQSDKHASYAHKIKKSDSIINWSIEAKKVYNMIRAFVPWPIAETSYGNKKIKIFSSEIINIKMPSGRIFITNDGYMGVGCYDQSIKILEMQIEGKTRCNSNHFIRGHQNIISHYLSTHPLFRH